MDPGAYLEIRHGLLLSPGGQHRRTFYDRNFSKMGFGILQGSFFSLSTSAVGFGVLCLPYVLFRSGYAFGVILIILTSIASQVSLRLLAWLKCDHEQTNHSSIALLAGGVFLKKVLSGMIMLQVFGTCVTYQIMTTTLI